MSAISIRGLGKKFGSADVLRDINLEIREGEFLVLVGPSGCGKSTLLRLLAGLDRATSGQILQNGADISAHAPRERNFSLIFQNYALFPHLTVRNNILFGMKMRGEPKAEFPQRLKKVADLLQLQPLLDRKPAQLSGGQRQRVAMARAIVREPALFLMDEPLSNLDAKLRGEVRDGIMALHNTLKTSTVYVTHDQIEAMTMADRIAVLDGGRLQQIGTPEALYRQPANMFVAGFIGTPAMNILRIPFYDQQAWLVGQPIARLPDYHEAEVFFGIRPEHLTEFPGGDGPRLQCRVLRRELHGAEYLITLDTPAGQVQYRRENRGAVGDVGQRLTLSFSSRDSYLFSVSSQLNLLQEQ
ncbi:ABC transporter ATP-binding protein [Acerihabitans arboris]|uniref:ATP-binding cassette domain-containing protein n=1 Tax=Acerihabitans arboris TaxID=2691583 RepID=A0A845SDG0_9GAMM|nr:ABC transporter ATP-binding protein [Acerihabitans arboris]NDL62820.1 ATP-binding cassette domain-containing protein [Acerihabitans arboris]